MKRWIVIGCCFLVPLFTMAQRKNILDDFLKNGCVWAGAGLSIPVGDFALKESTKGESGYANTGFAFNLGLKYGIIKELGLMVEYDRSVNSFDSKDLVNDLRARYPGYDFRYSVESWTFNSYMLGLYYTFQSYKTNLDLELMGGTANSTLPRMQWEEINIPANSTQEFIQEEKSTSSYSFGVGITLRRKISKDLLFMASGKYLHSTQTYKSMSVYSPTLGGFFLLPDYKQNFQIVTLTLGLAFQFD